MRILLLRPTGAEPPLPDSRARVDAFVARLERLLPGVQLEQVGHLDDWLLNRLESRVYDIAVLAQDARVITPEADFDAHFAALTRVSTTAPRVPVIYLAVSGNEWLAAAAIKYGATDYLPLELLEDGVLVRSIKTCLGGGRSRARHAAAPAQPAGAPATARGASPVRQRGAVDGAGRRAGPVAPAGRAGAGEDPGTMPDVPGYRIVRTVGRGGTATTWLALDQRRQRHVVIKFMNSFGGQDHLDGAEVFKREYEVIAAMNDRRVVKVYECGLLDDGAYLVVEYFPSGDLRRRMRRPMSVHAALGYARQIAQALRLIHGYGVFHRDLKPGNVMLREDGSVALIDFGLAKVSVGRTLPRAGHVIGTPSYLSPEQAIRAPVTNRSDLYSLGCILYELLTGTRPYTADTPIGVIDKHVKAPVPTLPSSLASLQPLIERTMAKDPADRFDSAAAVVAAIDQALRELPVPSAAS